jgi:peptidoglycan/LPS O-acetylase OafA/YrhL
MSYSLYLLHSRVEYLVMQVTRQLVAPDSIGFDLFTMLVTCVLCYVFYLCCEAPFVLSRRRVPQAAPDVATCPLPGRLVPAPAGQS